MFWNVRPLGADLNSGYASAFNRRHRRCGALYQSRFKAVSASKAAAGDAKNMRDSVAELLASTKEGWEQAKKDRNIIVRSIDGLRGIKFGQTHTIMRIKESSSGLAVVSISTEKIPSLNSYLIPFQRCGDEGDTGSGHSTMRNAPIMDTIGSTALEAMGLKIDVNILSDEVRLSCKLTEKDDLSPLFSKPGLADFKINVKILLISEGELPE